MAVILRYFTEFDSFGGDKWSQTKEFSFSNI